jgi:hypothetical protein
MRATRNDWHVLVELLTLRWRSNDSITTYSGRVILAKKVLIAYYHEALIVLVLNVPISVVVNVSSGLIKQ